MESAYDFKAGKSVSKQQKKQIEINSPDVKTKTVFSIEAAKKAVKKTKKISIAAARQKSNLRENIKLLKIRRKAFPKIIKLSCNKKLF